MRLVLRRVFRVVFTTRLVQLLWRRCLSSTWNHLWCPFLVDISGHCISDNVTLVVLRNTAAWSNMNIVALALETQSRNAVTFRRCSISQAMAWHHCSAPWSVRVRVTQCANSCSLVQVVPGINLTCVRYHPPTCCLENTVLRLGGVRRTTLNLFC